MPRMDMDRRTLRLFNRLRPMHLFKGVKDERLVALIPLLEPKTYQAGEVICEFTAPADFFGILDKGTVKLTRPGALREPVLEAGDYLGGEALIIERGRQLYTATARDEVILLKLAEADARALLQEQPVVRTAVGMMARTREFLFTRKWEWLPAGERVYLITQRHTILLWQRELLPAGVLVLALLLALTIGYFFGPGAALWWGGVLAALVGLWMFFTYVDWGNDFYVVTQQRVVYVEKIVLIYDSRTTVTMSALSAVNTETAGVADRLLDFGDVSVKTLSKPLVMRVVPYPQIVAAIVEEHMQRFHSQTRRSEFETIKSAIRNRLDPPLLQPRAEPPKTAKPGAPPTTPLGEQLRRYFSFQLRFDEGDTIVYRKHWWILLQDLLWPSITLLAACGLIGLSIGLGVLASGALPEPISEAALLLAGLVLFIPGAVWWWYQFEDWRNDIYKVTPDQIIDIYKKPLGRETRDSALLEHIQGLRSDRPSLVATLLNFGNVTATIPGKEFTFDDVLDPTGVQEDIQRRIEAMKARKGRGEALRRREELADVLSAYYAAVKDVEKRAEQNPPKPAGQT
jgi:hypothetical protein